MHIQDQADIPPQAGGGIPTSDHGECLAVSRLSVSIWKPGGKPWHPHISGENQPSSSLLAGGAVPYQGPGGVLRCGPPGSEWPLSHPLDVSPGARRVTALSLSFSPVKWE